ncbi:hypothetical protein MNB_SV-12-1711 [hydrothermal vent metagenome]|uniref:DUF2442 domain-containing protein n=1 Tax=hydrothermal vent metagenome TaxID=652676 RepID=A0A1W1CLJ1_9ZZZZ
MIKIINMTYIEEYIVKIEFSDGSYTNYDFSYLLSKKSVLTKPLRNQEYFKSFFLELGAICWKNGLELSPESLYEKARVAGELLQSEDVA